MDLFLLAAPVAGLLFGAYTTRVQQSGRDVSTDLLLTFYWPQESV